jgi:outer membrane protein
MKNISLIINVVLAIAIAILFYQVHSLKQNGVPETEASASKGDSSKAKVTINEIGPTSLADAKMAFINIDSINSRYLFIADESKKIKRQALSIQNQLETLTASFQADYEAYQQSAQTGIAPQNQIATMEEGLKRKEQEIKNKQLQLQDLQYAEQDKILELNEKLQQVVDQYNNGRFDYVFSYSETVPILVFKNKKLDISNDIIKILNDEYNAKKKK